MEKHQITPRRKDRAVQDESWIAEMLQNELFCTVSTSHENQPFVRPSAYYYDNEDHAVYIHGAHSGQAIRNLQANPKVCVCVFAVGGMRTHKRAFEFISEHAGVIAFGTASFVSDNEKKHFVMQETFAKFTPHLKPEIDYELASQQEIDETTVIKISIDHWSGKIKWTDDPQADKFQYDDVRKKRSYLPWENECIAPVTAEWENSTKKK